MREKKKIGRPESSVPINGEILSAVLYAEGYNKTSLGDAVYKSKQAISRSIKTNWMDEDLLESVCQVLNVAPSFIKDDVAHSKPVYDCDLHSVLAEADPSEYEKIMHQHFIGYSDDENIPVSLKYKSFPYSYERMSKLDVTEVISDWLVCCGIEDPSLFLDQNDILKLTAKLKIYTSQVFNEIVSKKVTTIIGENHGKEN